MGVMSASIVIMITLTSGTQYIDTQVKYAIETNLLIDNFLIIGVTQYEYIANDKEYTIRNRPAEEEWMKCYMEVSNYVNFFEAVMSSEKSAEFTKSLHYLLTGDLCEAIGGGHICFGYVDIAKKGLYGVAARALNNLMEIRVLYDSSNKTKEAKMEAFQHPFFVETEILWIYVSSTFTMLEDLLKNNVKDNINNFSKKAAVMIGCFTAGFIFIMLVVWRVIWNGFMIEREKMETIFKIIPLPIIRENNFVKNHLLAHTDHLLAGRKQYL